MGSNLEEIFLCLCYMRPIFSGKDCVVLLSDIIYEKAKNCLFSSVGFYSFLKYHCLDLRHLHSSARFFDPLGCIFV